MFGLKSALAPYLLVGGAVAAVALAGFFWYQHNQISTLTESLGVSMANTAKLETAAVQQENTNIFLEEELQTRQKVQAELDEKKSESSRVRQHEQARLNAHRGTLDERANEDAKDIECRIDRATRRLMRRVAEISGHKDGASESEEDSLSKAVRGDSC